MRISVQAEPFDLGDEIATFGSGHAVGARVTFSGVVRADGDLQQMQIEHYPGMTEAAIEKVATEATKRWALEDVLVIHRFGSLKPGETIMMVATAAPHRVAAFESAEFLMDFLKSRAPFWKKEIGPNSQTWVAAKSEDEDALDRWR